jgi:hypothetical protein
MLTAVLEANGGSDREILDGCRHEDLAWARRRLNARRDVHGHPGELAALQLALAGVDAGADFDAEPLDVIAHDARALEGTRRRIKAREEAVASRLHLGTLAFGHLAPDDRAMLIQERAPARVAELLGVLGGADDGGERQRRQDSSRLGRSLSACGVGMVTPTRSRIARRTRAAARFHGPARR